MSDETKAGPKQPEATDVRPARRTQKPDPSTWLDEDWSEKGFSSWPLSVKLSPILVPLIVIFIAVYYQHLTKETDPDAAARKKCMRAFDFQFNTSGVKHHAQTLSTQDWEIGTAAEAILELETAEMSVFGLNPFPRGALPASWFGFESALVYAYETIQDTGLQVQNDSRSAAAPATLGVPAIMLGKHWAGSKETATMLSHHVLREVPRHKNGAISYSADAVELRSDAVFMIPPFLAYYAVASKDLKLMKIAVAQVKLYRDELLVRDGDKEGLWKHIVGSSGNLDEGAWSTGNGWAAYGMARVRATVAAWPMSDEALLESVGVLDGSIRHIIEAAMRTDDSIHQDGLLNNYLGDERSFRESSGTTLLAAAAYRLVTNMEPGASRNEIVAWADKKRKVVLACVDEHGYVNTAVNAANYDQQQPNTIGSAQGESFLLLMAAAWRDCVCSKICSLGP